MNIKKNECLLKSSNPVVSRCMMCLINACTCDSFNNIIVFKYICKNLIKPVEKANLEEYTG